MSKPPSEAPGLPNAARQAATFDRIRQAHQTEVAEDYVELIADLIAVNGEARAVDLAERFGVSGATVNKVIARLQREGLVTSRPYRSIFLTDEGEEMAENARRRHQIVKDFLCLLGIEDDLADADAEGMEHHISDETLAVFQKIIEDGKLPERGKN